MARALTPDEYIALGDREVYEPYRKLQQELRALPEVPEKLSRLVAAVDAVITAYLAQWDAYKALTALTAVKTGPDPEKVKAAQEAYEQAVRTADERVQQLTAESQRLKS